MDAVNCNRLVLVRYVSVSSDTHVVVEELLVHNESFPRSGTSTKHKGNRRCSFGLFRSKGCSSGQRLFILVHDGLTFDPIPSRFNLFYQSPDQGVLVTGDKSLIGHSVHQLGFLIRRERLLPRRSIGSRGLDSRIHKGNGLRGVFQIFMCCQSRFIVLVVIEILKHNNILTCKCPSVELKHDFNRTG